MRKLVLLAFIACPPGVMADSMGLAECESAALSQHPSIRLAREETRVAHLKKNEAFRSVFPMMTVKGEITEGVANETLATPDFLEESYGVQMSQPLFQGGRLSRAYRQAKYNYLSVKAKEEKARQEVLFGVRESYWNLAKAGMVKQVFDGAHEDLIRDRQMAVRLFEKDAISRQVFNTMISQAEQALLNRNAAQADEVARLWNWTAALGLDEPPVKRPPLIISSTTATVPPLAECVSEAMRNHPDMTIQKFAREAALNGDLSGRGLYAPKLSVNGFYGRSGGAYTNENFSLREDWQVGAQVSQMFGGSSANASVQHIKTSPKLGQSTRTESRTYNGAINIEDSYRQKTEKAEARLAYEQAEEEFRRTNMEVANNVRAAYAELIKAISQVNIAASDFSVAKTEFEVARIKSSNREVPMSDRSSARNRLAQAEVAWIDARAQYQVAVSGLARAMGVLEISVVLR